MRCVPAGCPPENPLCQGAGRGAAGLPRLHALPVADIMAQLQAITGIGRWSAEIYVMFSLGYSDILPAGDLALQESARMLFELADRPSEKQLVAMAEKWQPWRSVAAQILWAYYRVAKEREGIR